jgi:hypothetical protein
VQTGDDPFVRADELPDDFLSEIDKELEALTAPAAQGPELKAAEPEPDGFDLSDDPGIRQMQETYLEIVRQALGPVDRYLKAMSSGENYREILELCEMIVNPLVPKTEQVGLHKLADDLVFFRSLLNLALGERDQTGMEAMREVVMEGFVKLSEGFGLTFRGYRLAVKNLVLFYRDLKHADGVSESDIRRFFAIGVPSLTWIRRTHVADLQSLSGVEPGVIHEIRKLAYAYRQGVAMSGASLAKELPKLPELDDPLEISEEEILAVDVGETDVDTVDVKAPRGTA